MVFGPYCLVRRKHLLSSASHDHSDGSGILRRFSPLLAIEGVLEPQNHPRQICKPVPSRQIVLVVCNTTSSAASTGVANLEAAPEVAQKNSL